MKQSPQARLSSAQIQAIRRKRQEGWTPRQIEQDTGVDHVTVWRHARNIKPNREGPHEEARYNGQSTIVAPPALVPASATTFSNVPSQMGPVAHQYAPQANPSQQATVQTSPQILSPQNKPRIGEYVIEEVDRKERKGWYDRVWDEEQRYLVHRVKMAIREKRLLEAKQKLAETQEDLRKINRKAVAQLQAQSNEGGIWASDILALLTAQAAERIHNGMDPREAARRFGQDVDTWLLLFLANR